MIKNFSYLFRFEMAYILGLGTSGFVSVYEADTGLVLKGYEVWHGGRCKMRFEPAEDSKANFAGEDAV